MTAVLDIQNATTSKHITTAGADIDLYAQNPSYTAPQNKSGRHAIGVIITYMPTYPGSFAFTTIAGDDDTWEIPSVPFEIPVQMTTVLADTDSGTKFGALYV